MRSVLHMIVGSTEAREHLALLRRFGWGRMWLPGQTPRAYEGERFGLDNGAFLCWRRGAEWDGDGWRRWIDKCHGGPAPYLAVLPDIVCGGLRSLEFSAGWIDRLPRDWPWYLAVQNGQTTADVAPLLPRVAGLFLGGDDAFKASAHLWADLAHAAGKKFHYARAGTLRKLTLARFSGADSCDSVFPIWIKAKRERFAEWWSQGECQLLLPWS